MAGTPRGSIEHFIADSGQDGSRDAFVSILNQFELDPNMVRVSSYYGNGGATGFDYSSGANPAGENGWAVWSKSAAAGTYYVQLQWSANETIGGGGGAPANSSGSDGVALSMAYDTSGAIPWNGTVNNNGADTKGTPVWVPAGGNLVVFPRGNGTGGTYATNKEAMASVYSWGSPNNRLQIVGDADYLWIAQDTGSSGSYDRQLYIGPYTPAAGVAPDLPLLMFQLSSSLTLNSDLGTIDNTSQEREGGVTAQAATSGARILRLGVNSYLQTVELQPNSQRTTPSFDAQSLGIILQDAEGVGTFGFLGFVDLLTMVFNVPTHDTNVGLTKVYIGGSSTNTRKLVVDWDGATMPGSGATIIGVQF